MHPSPEQLALLALGEHDALSAAERLHVESCDICLAELVELAQVVALGRSEQSTVELLVPPARVWDRIVTELAEPLTASAAVSRDLDTNPNPVRTLPVTSLPPLDGTTVDGARPSIAGVPAAVSPSTQVGSRPAGRRRSRRWVGAAIAAAVALILGGAIGYGVGRARQPGMTVVAEAQLSATPTWSGSSGSAVLHRNAEGQLIMTLDLRASRPLDGIQAAWLIDPARPNEPMPLGLLDRDQGIWSVNSAVNLQQYKIIDVSEEPAGDTDPRHSGNSIVRGTLG